MAFTLPSGPRGDSPSAKGRRKKSRASVGKAITKAGSSKPTPKPKPEPGARSTGKTIQRSGATLKPEPKRKPRVSSAFGDKPLAKADFREQRREQRDKVRGAADRMPQRVRLPRLPLLREYNEQQRQTIIDRTTDAVQRGIRAERSQGGSAQSALRKAFELDNEDGQRRLGDKETRRALNKLSGAVDTRKTDIVRRELKANVPRDEAVQIYNDAETQAVKSGSEAKPGKPMAKVEAMGISVPVGAITRAAGDRIFSGQGKSAQKWARLATAPAVATDEAIRNPGPTAKSSAKMAIATAKGAIPGAIQAVTDPKKAAKQTGDAYKRLYGPLMEGRTGEFRRQVRDEGAGVQVAFDTATVASGVGRVAGLGAKAGIAGKTAKTLMTDNRPMLRTGAGRGQVRRQQVSGNIFKAAGQRAVDRNRRRAQRKDAERPEGARGLQPAPGRTETEVVKASKMAQRKDQRVDVAKTRARGFVRLTRLQDAEIRDKNTGLRGARKRAYKVAGDKQLAADLEAFVLRGTTRPTAQGTRDMLGRLREIQLENRKKAADEGRDLATTPDTDAVAAIDRILAKDDAEIQRALDALNEFKAGEVQRDRRILAEDKTGLTKDQVERRRRGAQAIALGDEVPKTKGLAKKTKKAMKLGVKREEKNLSNARRSEETARRGYRQAVADARVDVARPKTSQTLEALTREERAAQAELAKLKRSQGIEKRRTSRAEGRAESKARQAERDYLRTDEQYAETEKTLGAVNARKNEVRGLIREIEGTGDSAPELRAELATLSRQSRELNDARAQRAQELMDVSPKVPEGATKKQRQQALARRKPLQAKRGKYAARAAESRSETAPGRPITSAIVQTRERLGVLRKDIQAERRRISGVSPERADKLRRAIDAKDEAAAATKKQRERLGIAKEARREVRGVTDKDMQALAEGAMNVRAAQQADKLGMGDAVYVPDRGTSRTDHGAFASGPTAVNGWNRTEFERFRQGVFDVTPDAYEAGVARTIKQSVNWDTAADILERNAVSSGMTLNQAQEFMRRNGLSDEGYAVVDMNIIRRAKESAPDQRMGDVDTSDALGSAIEQATLGSKSSIVGKDTVDTTGALAKFDQGRGKGTFIVAPRAVVEEITKEVRAGNPVSRGFQKLQGVTSALILSTSPLFVPIQVASNIALAVPGSRGRILKAPYRKWRREIEAQGADPATLGMIDEYLGASPMSELSRSPKFGGSTENRLAAFYQMMADSKAVEAARETKWNPLTWNRRMDKAQNDFFRREAFFAKLERDMKSRSNAIVREAEQLADALRMPPGQEKIQALRAAEPAMERIAGHVDDMLGNWTAYTARERALGKSAVLFYGFMRFATKLALYHLPVNHPIVTNILRQLGQLNMQDVEDLLSAEFLRDGRKNGYTEEEVRRAIRRELISQFGGRIYFTRGGQLGYIDLARITPLTSPIFDLIADPRSGTFNLMSPALGSIAETLLKERSSGAKLNTHGLFTKFGSEPKIDLGDGVRIFMRDMTRTVPALRTLDDTLGTGGAVQGDDSLPFLDDRPLTPLTERQQQRADRTTKGSPESAALRAAQSLFTPVKLDDTTSLSRVQQSADYPELDRLKYELQQEQKRLKDAGRVELVSPKTKELKQRIGFIETRAGIRPKRKKKDGGSFGGLSGGGGSFGGLGGGRNGFGGL